MFPTFYGLAEYLLGINSTNYRNSPHRGSLWKNFVFTEIIKVTGALPGRNLFYYRDQNNVEVDFVYETPSVKYLIEAKASEKMDERKLNFTNVAPLFKDKKIKNLLLSCIYETSTVHLKNHDIANPLLVNCFDMILKS